jgi:hypothetical protein
MRLLVDEDTASATLITRLLAAAHEVVQVPHGTLDEVVFNEAQRLALPMLTANVGRTGRHDQGGSTSSLLNGFRTVVLLASFALRQVVGSRIA